jgi:hypothetical protein
MAGIPSTRPRYSQTDIDSAFDQLADASDRAVILVGGSLLEFALEEAILSRIRPLTEDERRKLFAGQGAFLELLPTKYWARIFSR